MGSNGSFWQNKSVLVTGGAGFIGSHVVELLVEAGAHVTVLDSLISGNEANLAAVRHQIQLINQDIRTLDWAALLTAHPCAVLFHLAANAYVPPSVETPEYDYAVNLDSTFRLLSTLRQTKWAGRFVFASSAAVYGNAVQLPITEDDATVPVSPYGVSKLAAERYVAVFSRLYGLHLASARFFSAYGPRQKKQVVYDFLEKLRRNPAELCIHGDGSQVRDFLYVADAARAALLVAERGSLNGEAYNIGAGAACSIAELAAAVCTTVGVQPRFIYSGPNRPGDPEKLTVNINRLKAIGYDPQTTLANGLRHTIEWYNATMANPEEIRGVPCDITKP